MEFRFRDSVVLIAGGTGALGAAVSRAFYEEGATVAVTYRSQEEYERLLKTVPGDHSRFIGRHLDATDVTAVAEFAAQVASDQGRLDAMVNAVGGYAGGISLWELQMQQLDRMLDLNLRASFATAKAVLPIMLKQGHGSIVNVAAKAAVLADAGASAYSASKAAALALMTSLAAELQGTGVRVNTLMPSIIDTTPNRAAMPDANHEKWPKPEQLARVILFLCSTDAVVIHGAAIAAYGNS